MTREEPPSDPERAMSDALELIRLAEALCGVIGALESDKPGPDRLVEFMETREDRLATLATRLLLSKYPGSPQALAKCEDAVSGDISRLLGYETQGWALDERITRQGVLAQR